jgi:hypothetical protein
VYWELGGEKNFLGPLFSFNEEGGRTHAALRPFLASYDAPRDWLYVFPLGKSTEEKSYFFPVYMRHKALGAHDLTFFPFFYGKTKEGKSYAGVFPFYGKLYNRFRRDEIGFFLWPLYTYSKWDGTKRTSAVWPLFAFYSGHEEGFKLGPLYGEHRVGERRKSQFVLWPIFIKDEKDLDTDDPKKSLWAVPFYMQTTSPRSSYHAVMWPFFTYMKTPYKTELKAPWPVYTHTTGKTESGTGMWPFYSHNRSGKDEVTYVMWPVYKGTERYPADKKFTYRRILLIDRYEQDDRGTYLNVCPFFEYRKKGGESRFYFPSVMPWRSADYDRIVRPLLTLYDYRKMGDKTATNVLYGLYTKEGDGEYWKSRFAFLLEVKREREGMGFQVLSGLFGIDGRQVKVFYIPIKRDEGRIAAAEGLPSEGRVPVEDGPAAGSDGPQPYADALDAGGWRRTVDAFSLQPAQAATPAFGACGLFDPTGGPVLAAEALAPSAGAD